MEPEAKIYKDIEKEETNMSLISNMMKTESIQEEKPEIRPGQNGL